MFSISILTIEFLILGCLTAFGIDARPVALSSALILAFSIALFLDFSRNKTIKKYAIPLSLGYILRLGLLYFDYFCRNIYVLPNSGADSEAFYRLSVQFSIGNNYFDAITTLAGVVFKLFGVSRLYGQFLLMLFSIVALIFAAKTIEYIDGSQKVKKGLMFLLCLMPNFAILSSLFLRESVVAMFLSISFYYFVNWMASNEEKSFWIAFVFSFCSAFFHSGSVGAAVGYIVIRALYNRKTKRFSFSLRNVLPVLVLLIIFLFLYTNYSNILFYKMAKIKTIDTIANVRSMGGSSYAKYVGDSSTIRNMVIYSIPRMFYFLFSPLPWQWRGLSDIIAFCFNSLFYMVTIVRVCLYFIKHRKENRNILIGLLIVALCLLFIFGWGTSNVGTAVRHRDKAVILYGLLLCCTLKNEKDEVDS